MRRALASALLALTIAALAACWRDGPGPTAPPVRPPPTAPAAEREPAHRPRWVPGHAGSSTAAQRSRSPFDVAVDLAAELRTPGTVLSYVANAIVVLDLDASTVSTACDATAFALLRRLEQLFTDPARSRLICRASQPAVFTCAQVSSQPIVIVEVDPDQRRIISVIIGSQRISVGANMGRFRNQIATATCP